MNSYNILRKIDDLNSSKADIDLDNTSPSQNFKDMCIGWCMPDYDNGIDIRNFSSSANQYTVPACGVINVSGVNYSKVYLNDKLFIQIIGVAPNGSAGSINANAAYMFPVNKGDRVYIPSINSGGDWSNFFPYKGVNS